MTVTAMKLRNIGPKSAAWLRQVGLRTREDLEAAGTIEGALKDCHWQDVTEARRGELVAAAEAAIAQLPPPRGRPAAAPVTTTMMASADEDHAADTLPHDDDEPPGYS